MRILLGISGGIAAYKAPELVRTLRRANHEVRCVATANGLKMVSAHALAAVSGAAVASELFPSDGTMPHIGLARWAEVMLIAPASADLLAKIRLGLADDLLTTMVLALEPDRPLWLAPAMNTVMWEKPVVQENRAVLVERGMRFIDPVPGNLACGETGVGAMADLDLITALISQKPTTE